MNSRRLLCIAAALISPVILQAAPLAPLHGKCTIGLTDDTGRLRLEVMPDDCSESRHCRSNFSSDSLSRLTGVSVEDLASEGANLTATLAGEPGTFTCSGTVHERKLDGTSVFVPNQAFQDRMGQLGFTGFDSDKLMAYTFVGVDSKWVQSLQQTGVNGMDVNNLIALRIFKVDPEYIRGITAMGYQMPDAGKLIALKVQNVNTDEVRQIRALGFQPTLDELIQIRIFHVTPEFIRRMQDRGLKNLTIAKLVQIRIFKLDE